MTVDWSKKNQAIFQEALQGAFSDYEELEQFVYFKLDESLPNFVERTGLKTVTFNLLKWAILQQRLDELFQKFCEDHPRLKDSLIAKLQPQPLISRLTKLLETDWESLFDLLKEEDSAYVEIAVRYAFKTTYSQKFETLQPDRPPLNEPALVQNLLKTHDNPTLAVRFVESVIVELQRSSEGSNRDLTDLERWRDRISQQHNVLLKSAESAKPTACHAYLLVALEAIGSDVNVYPELHITGTEKPVRFGAQPATCSVDKVADLLSQWICQAEDALDDTCEDGQVTLELFLPYQYLEEDIATWNVRDKRGDEILLGWHRRFLVRSSDRVRDRQIQRSLKSRWKKLEACVEAKNAGDQFHLQKDCPSEKGALRSLLDDKESPGLKFVGQLPTDAVKRTDFFKDIIDAAIPIALWSSEMAELDIVVLEAEFDTLLKSCCLTNFADLAKHWRQKRRVSEHIRLLCDRHDRLPNLPDPDREEDLLVAS